MKLGFVVFCNTAFPHPTRILNEASEFGVFDFIRYVSEKDIPEFITKHSDFIRAHKKGYGLYIWKPKIILDTLQSMNDDDILVYCDAGMKINKKGLPRFHEYMKLLADPNQHMVVFSTNKSYVPQFYVTQRAIMSYFPDFNDKSKYDHYCYAGVMMLKKTKRTIQAITEWLDLCEHYQFIHPTTPSTHKEIEGFQGNDFDNALFNLVLAKHQIHVTIYPDETNLYNSNGGHNLTSTDWSSLDNFPFQCRRLFPRT